MSINEKNITRGGEFIIKETNCENVFSPEDFSEEQLMMKQAVSDFIDKEVYISPRISISSSVPIIANSGSTMPRARDLPTRQP